LVGFGLKNPKKKKKKKKSKVYIVSLLDPTRLGKYLVPGRVVSSRGLLQTDVVV
jgi:methionine-rich copper-binding protein CopC